MLMYNRSLLAGPADIQVYGDGSFNAVLSLGSWAFAIPELSLYQAAVDSGTGIETFEVLAILAGLRAVLAVDHTERPIQVHSDSQFAHSFWKHAGERTLPNRKSFDRVRHLFDLAVGLLAQRQVMFLPVTAACGPYRDCHRRAAKTLRHAVATNTTMATELALGIEREHHQRLLQKQEDLQAKLTIVEDELLLTSVRLRALEQAASATSYGISGSHR